MTGVVVIYDGACGACSAIAAALSDVLAPPVLIRSCRDPHLTTEFPVLAGHLTDRPCRRPLMVTTSSGGSAVVSGGAAMMWRGLRMVAPGRRLAAARLGLRILRRRARRV